VPPIPARVAASNPAGQQIEVTDEQGRVLLVLPFMEVLESLKADPS
jgi:hypothetical protein